MLSDFGDKLSTIFGIRSSEITNNQFELCIASLHSRKSVLGTGGASAGSAGPVLAPSPARSHSRSH
jgi:hypothetical protein